MYWMAKSKKPDFLLVARPRKRNWCWPAYKHPILLPVSTRKKFFEPLAGFVFGCSLFMLLRTAICLIPQGFALCLRVRHFRKKKKKTKPQQVCKLAEGGSCAPKVAQHGMWHHVWLIPMGAIYCYNCLQL